MMEVITILLSALKNKKWIGRLTLKTTEAN